MILSIVESMKYSVSRDFMCLCGMYKNPPGSLVHFAEDVSVFSKQLYTEAVAGIKDSMNNFTKTGIFTMYNVPVLTNVKYGIQAYILNSLTIVYPEVDVGFMSSIPHETKTALLRDNKSFPFYRSFMINNNPFDMFQMSTIGSNCLARYGQYVTDMYIVPHVRMLCKKLNVENFN